MIYYRNTKIKLQRECYKDNVDNLITCKKCRREYVGSYFTRFLTPFNNYRSCHRKFCRGNSVIEVSFYARFMLDGHCGIDDWEIILIDKGCNKQETEKNSSFSNISLTRLYRTVSMSVKWAFSGYNRTMRPFWINFELGQ